MVKNPPANAGDVGSPLHWEDSLEKEMTTLFSILAWEIPWTEETAELQSMEKQSARHDLVAKQQQQKI